MKKGFGLVGVLIIVGIIAIGGGGYYYFEKEHKIEVTDKNMGEKYINFCGQSYKTNISYLENIDILEIIENIAKTENPSLICNNINDNMSGHEIGVVYKKWSELEHISTTEKQEKNIYLIALYKKDVKEERLDPFNQSIVQFKFDLDKKEVYFQNQFSGNFNLIGNF